MPSRTRPPTLNDSRLLYRLNELASIGSVPGGGVTRLAYSAEDVAARDRVGEWMTEAGLTVEVDPACNLIGSAPGTAAESQLSLSPIVSGSHLDTVINGGRLDGAYGVVAAIEVAAALRGHHQHPLTVVAFANEEGVGGAESFDGSRAIVGRPGPLDAVDRSGRSLAQRLDSAGGCSAKLGQARWRRRLAAFFELHIEQGPILDQANSAIGVVTGITGQRKINIDIVGRANHAGTTPMDLRCDALAVAAEAVLIVQGLPKSTGVRVATTGICTTHPNARNVIPSRVHLGAEVRDLDLETIERATTELSARLDALASRSGAAITLSIVDTQPPVPTDAHLLRLLEAAAEHVGSTAVRMPSGAGHDAQIMADLGPTCMLFVPSRDGLSHSPAEYTDPDALVLGAKVLLAAVIRFDQEVSHGR